MLKQCLTMFVPLILISSVGYHLQTVKGLETGVFEVILGLVVVVLNLRRYAR